MKRMYKFVKVGYLSLVMFFSTAVSAAPINSGKGSDLKVRNVVLVHGAWADGSSWSGVIAHLQAQGMHVTAVQNSLPNMAEAVKAVQWVLNRQDGPTVLVGHSWGGTVISEVGSDPKVSALVYVAARAPDTNEDFVTLAEKFPAGPAHAGVQNDGGLTVLSEDAFMKYFANGVPQKQAKILYSVQVPTAATIFNERTTTAAWRDKPAWYAVSKQDQTINPDLQRFLAKRMKAETIEVNGGHLALVSHSKQISELIVKAAKAAEKNVILRSSSYHR